MNGSDSTPPLAAAGQSADAAGAAPVQAQLARVIHLDESDMRVYFSSARTGEWAISGGFEFSNWSQADLAGKARQAFTNGWLGVETFGRATFVAVTPIESAEIDELEKRLARHFVTTYDAPTLAAAQPVARSEIAHMLDMCADHAPNTVLAVTRELTDAGVREQFRAIKGSDADLVQFSVHGGAPGA